MIVKHKFISAGLRLKQAAGKWHLAKAKAVSATMDHVKYIQSRPGPDRDSGGRSFFDDAQDKISGREVRNWIKERYEGRNVVAHTFLFAPELDPGDDQEYTRHLMKSLGDRLGLDLDWRAVTHKNTDNHHVHVVVLPKDKNGRQVTIDLSDCRKLMAESDFFLSREQPLSWKRVERERQERELAKVDTLMKKVSRKHKEFWEHKAQQKPPVPFLGSKWRLMRVTLPRFDMLKKAL